MGLARLLASRAAITTAALLVGCTLAELVARGCSQLPLPRPITTGEVLAGSDDPELRYANGPGRVQTMAFRGADGTVVREVVHAINARGWRGPEAARKAPGVQRIACVGDSLTFGLGVGERETWPAQLEDALAAERVEALNLGVGGYDLEQKARLAEKHALELEADVVLVQWFLNDARFDGERGGPALKRSWWTPPLKPGRWAWLDLLRARLRCVDLVARRLQSSMSARSFASLYAHDLEPGKASRARVEAALDRIAAIGRRGAARVALVVFPMPFEEDGQWLSSALDAEVAALARERGLPVIDLEHALHSRGGRECRIHPFDYHYDARGLAAAADETARFLRESGWLGE